MYRAERGAPEPGAYHYVLVRRDLAPDACAQVVDCYAERAVSRVVVFDGAERHLVFVREAPARDELRHPDLRGERPGWEDVTDAWTVEQARAGSPDPDLDRAAEVLRGLPGGLPSGDLRNALGLREDDSAWRTLRARLNASPKFEATGAGLARCWALKDTAGEGLRAAG